MAHQRPQGRLRIEAAASHAGPAGPISQIGPAGLFYFRHIPQRKISVLMNSESGAQSPGITLAASALCAYRRQPVSLCSSSPEVAFTLQREPARFFDALHNFGGGNPPHASTPLSPRSIAIIALITRLSTAIHRVGHRFPSWRIPPGRLWLSPVHAFNARSSRSSNSIFKGTYNYYSRGEVALLLHPPANHQPRGSSKRGGLSSSDGELT